MAQPRKQGGATHHVEYAVIQIRQRHANCVRQSVTEGGESRDATPAPRSSHPWRPAQFASMMTPADQAADPGTLSSLLLAAFMASADRQDLDRATDLTAAAIASCHPTAPEWSDWAGSQQPAAGCAGKPAATLHMRARRSSCGAQRYHERSAVANPFHRRGLRQERPGCRA